MKPTSIPVDPITKSVNIRGLNWPVQGIRDMMAETGGIVVTNENLNLELDAAIAGHFARGGKSVPKQLFVEALPGSMFVPYRIKAHHGKSEGVRTNRYLYFMVSRLY
jgi:hypothetical protein